MDVLMYSREGCHLCDDALALLQAEGLAVRVVDVDTNPSLVEKHGECVPVVAIDGRVRFRGRIDPLLLRRILLASEQNASE